MAEHSKKSASEIAEKYEGRHKDPFVKAADHAIEGANKPGGNGVEAYLKALDLLKKSERESKSPEKYRMLAQKAGTYIKGYKEQPPRKGNIRIILQQYQDFITSCKFKAREP